jgi:hypothetical protein
VETVVYSASKYLGGGGKHKWKFCKVATHLTTVVFGGDVLDMSLYD